MTGRPDPVSHSDDQASVAEQMMEERARQKDRIIELLRKATHAPDLSRLRHPDVEAAARLLSPAPGIYRRIHAGCRAITEILSGEA